MDCGSLLGWETRCDMSSFMSSRSVWHLSTMRPPICYYVWGLRALLQLGASIVLNGKLCQSSAGNEGNFGTLRGVVKFISHNGLKGVGG